MSNSPVKPQLHLIQNTLSLASFERQFMRLVDEGDSLLFLNDSVFELLQQEYNTDTFVQFTRKASIFVIDEQVHARGIFELPNKNIKITRYPQFVELCQNAAKIVSW